MACGEIAAKLKNNKTVVWNGKLQNGENSIKLAYLVFLSK